TFFVNISTLDPSTVVTVAKAKGTGTIVNDDPIPAISIGNVSIKEGDSGPSSAVFAVTLSNPSSEDITINFTTADGTAKVADSDYVGVTTPGTLIIPKGTTAGTISITVTGDTKNETDETFFVNLTTPDLLKATVAVSTATGI